MSQTLEEHLKERGLEPELKTAATKPQEQDGCQHEWQIFKESIQNDWKDYELGLPGIRRNYNGKRWHFKVRGCILGSSRRVACNGS